MNDRMVCKRCGITLVWAVRGWKHAPGRAGVRGCRWPLATPEAEYVASHEAALRHATTDALVARSDADALDALKRALDR